ncbi:MAG: metal ABC transporter solute-binding protein, Zn/Mn family [Fimbriiglobus sp.]
MFEFPRRWFLAVIAVAPVLAGCGPDGAARTANDPLPVVATTGMIADAVKQVGGPRVSVECLMGPGVDPHRFQPSAGDLGKLGRAKLVFYNGLHLEGKMTDVLEGASGRHGKAVAVTARLDPAKDLRTADGADGAHDPHVWFDVSLWAKCVAVVRDELAAADPAHAAEYTANGNAYIAELEKLHAEVKAKAEGLPKDRRVLVTSHDAFGYFGAAYGFEVHGLQGVSTAAETTTRDVQQLAELLKSKKVPAVFGETSVPPKGLQAVLDSVGHAVKLIGGPDALYSDALGEPGTPGETYTGMVRHNVAVIVGALGK